MMATAAGYAKGAAALSGKVDPRADKLWSAAPEYLKRALVSDFRHRAEGLARRENGNAGAMTYAAGFAKVADHLSEKAPDDNIARGGNVAGGA